MIKFFRRIRKANRLLNAPPILRRYFAMNGFDGCLTALGVIFGSFIARVEDPMIVIITTASTAFALFISGFSAAYFVEKAERLKDIKDLEKRLLHSLKKSGRFQASYIVSLEAAFVDGFSPFLMAVIILSPFFLASNGLISVLSAFYSSIFISLILVFVLGFYLGRISGQNALTLGVKMLLAGILALLVSLSLSIL